MSDTIQVVDEETTAPAPATDIKKNNLKKRWSKYVKAEDFQAEISNFQSAIDERPTRYEIESMVEEEIGKLIDMLKEVM